MADAFSPGLLDAIKGFEGYSATPSWDYNQYSSGWGTRSKPGEIVDKDTHEQRLRDEVTKAAGIVDSQVPGLPAGVRDAMISLTYNSGDKWARSGLGEKLRAGDYEGAKDLFTQYNKAGGRPLQGLINRRNTEASWFDSTNIPDNTFASEPASGSPAGMPVQAADDFSAVASMRGPRMADEAPGLLASLAGQQQQGGGGIGGLLGSLNPEKMAYLAMIAKGLNPYTDVNPVAMLKLAYDKQQEAEKLARQKLEHADLQKYREGNLDISTRAENRQQAEIDRKIAEAKAEQEAYGELLRRRAAGAAGVPTAGDGGAVPYLGNPFGAAPAASDAGAPGAEGQFGATSDPGAEGALGAQGATSPPGPAIPFPGGIAAPPGVPDFRGAPAAAAAPDEGGMTRQNIEDFLSRFPNAKSAPQLRAHLDKLDAREEKRGEPARLRAEREQTAIQLGIPKGSKAWQQMITEGKVSRPEISAGDQGRITKAEDELVGQRNTLENLQEALSLTGQTKDYQGFGANLMATVAGKFPRNIPGVDYSQADAASRLNQILNSEGIQNMSRTMKGATTDFEMRKWLSFAADLSLPVNVREKYLKRAIGLYEDEIQTREKRIDQIRSGDYYKPQGGQSGRPGGANVPQGGGPPDPLGLR
jgi:GH24 family phage-related lysozyme (muramidase)